MRVAVTGTREGMTDAQRATFGTVLLPLDLHGADAVTEFHHGSCQGVDVQAARLARYVLGDGVRVVCHPGPAGHPCREDSGVDDEVRPAKTHFARNRDLVDGADVLVACPLRPDPIGKNTPGGTAYTVNYARKKGRRIIIIGPDGSITEEAAR